MAEPRGWVPIAQNIWWNPKVKQAAADLTGGDVEKLVGHLARLWAWALDQAEDGDLSHISDRDLIRVMNLPTRPQERLRKTLTNARLITQEGRINGWEEWVGNLLDKRARDRARKRAERERRRSNIAVTQPASAGRPSDNMSPADPPELSMSRGQSRGQSVGRPDAPRPDRDRTATETVPPSPRTAVTAGATEAGGTSAPTPEQLDQQDRADRIVSEATGLWRTALSMTIRSSMTLHNFVTWFERTRLEQRGQTYYIVAPNEFQRDWLNVKYEGLLRASIGVLVDEIAPDVRVVLEADVPAQSTAGAA